MDPNSKPFSMPFKLSSWLREVIVKGSVDEAHNAKGENPIYRIWLIDDGEIMGWQESFLLVLHSQTVQVEVIGRNEENCLETRTLIQEAAEIEHHRRPSLGTAPAVDNGSASQGRPAPILESGTMEATSYSGEDDSVCTNQDGTLSGPPDSVARSGSIASTDGGAVVDAANKFELGLWALSGGLRESLKRDDDKTSFKSNLSDL